MARSVDLLIRAPRRNRVAMAISDDDTLSTGMRDRPYAGRPCVNSPRRNSVDHRPMDGSSVNYRSMRRHPMNRQAVDWTSYDAVPSDYLRAEMPHRHNSSVLGPSTMPTVVSMGPAVSVAMHGASVMVILRQRARG